MARMRTGRRLTPQTTDPQGNRIADPDVYGKKINNNEIVSSWPEVRQMYQSGRFNTALKGRSLNPDVKNYLEGKTNKLDDKEFEEPIISRTKTAEGGQYADFNTFFRKGGKNYARVEKTVGLKPSKEGEMNYYDSGQTSKNINEWRSAGAGGGEDLNRYRVKQAEFNPDPNPQDQKTDETTIDRIPMLKPQPIKIAKKKIKTKTTELPDFVYPEKDVKNKYGRQLNPGGNGVVKAKYKPGAELKAGKAIKGSKTINERKYNREKELFKAKASTGARNLDISDLSSKDIKDIRKNYLRNDLREAKRDLSVSPEVRAKNIAASKMEIQQSRKGQRYAKKQEKGKLSYFAPEKIQEYKFSQDNATNRNTIQQKLDQIGRKAKEKAIKGSFGEMPMRG